MTASKLSLSSYKSIFSCDNNVSTYLDGDTGTASLAS